MLSDPRRLRLNDMGDGIWLRVVDVKRALEGRRYLIDGKVSLQLTDPFLPDNTGIYTLEAGPDGASVTRGSSNPDISLDIATLGAAYLGGTRLSLLAAAGRVEEHTPGTLRLADAMFSSEIVPWCTHHF
jgi:predicted acetyltransferase